jgi:hypothetical protein
LDQEEGDMILTLKSKTYFEKVPLAIVKKILSESCPEKEVAGQPAKKKVRMKTPDHKETGGQQ